jgi:hypothetical protein
MVGQCSIVKQYIRDFTKYEYYTRILYFTVILRTGVTFTITAKEQTKIKNRKGSNKKMNDNRINTA